MWNGQKRPILWKKHLRIWRKRSLCLRTIRKLILHMLRPLARYGRVEEAVDYINNEIIVRFPDIYENSQFLILIQEMEEWK